MDVMVLGQWPGIVETWDLGVRDDGAFVYRRICTTEVPWWSCPAFHPIADEAVEQAMRWVEVFVYGD